MAANTKMMHVRIDEDLLQNASEILAEYGLTVSDAVRMFLTRVVKDRGLPPEMMIDPKIYDAWFKSKVQEALDDPSPDIPHAVVMEGIRAKLASKSVV